MRAEEIERKLKTLLDAVVAADRDFDRLYARSMIRKNPSAVSLAANLDYLREELDLLVKDAIWPGLLA